MISGFIVISSVVLAAIFGIAWLTRPGLRKRIEDPKYAFQAQLQAYNPPVDDSRTRQDGRTDASD